MLSLADRGMVSLQAITPEMLLGTKGGPPDRSCETVEVGPDDAAHGWNAYASGGSY